MGFGFSKQVTYELNPDRNEGVQQVVPESIRDSGREMNEDTGMNEVFRVILWKQTSLDNFK